MNTFSTEKELSTTLDVAEKLIRDCVNGQITFDTFLAKYDSFYMRYALDGHESDADESSLFEKYSSRIALHKAIWDEIITRITSDDFASQFNKHPRRFINHSEGLTLLRRLAQEFLA